MWLVDMIRGTKQNRFYELAQRICDTLVDAAETLERYAQTGAPELPDKIDQLQRDADNILADTIIELTNTFITPFDRQDIFNLAEDVDNMVGYLNNAAREIKLFQTGSTPAMCEMAGILTKGAREIQIAILALRDDASEAQIHAANACKTEQEMESLYRQTLAALFAEPDVHRILKLREVYRHFSNSADQANAIGRQISKTVVKTA